MSADSFSRIRRRESIVRFSYYTDFEPQLHLNELQALNFTPIVFCILSHRSARQFSDGDAAPIQQTNIG